jgi:hypothetical protein
MLRFFLFAALLVAYTNIFAQKKTVLPVRIDGLWGYINQRGKVIIPAKYDAISDTPLPWHGQNARGKSRFRLVSIGDKCGLLNEKKEEIFEPVFDQIYALSDTLFLVYQDTLRQIRGLSGQIVLDVSAWDDVSQPMPGKDNWASFYFVKKAGKWGIADRKGSIIVAPKYYYFRPYNFGKGIFVVQDAPDGLKKVINYEGKAIFDKYYENVVVYSANCFQLTEKKTPILVDANGNNIFNKDIIKTKPLGKQFLKIEYDSHKQGKSSLVRTLFSLIDNTTVIEYSDKDLEYLDEKHLVLVDDEGNRFIANNLGRAMSKFPFKKIKSSGDENLFVVVTTTYQDTFSTRWGLFDLKSDSLKLRSSYHKIHPFVNEIAIVESGLFQGVLNKKGQEIVPCIYPKITLEENFVKAISDTAVIVFEIKEDGSLAKSEQFRETMNINVVEAEVLEDPDFVKQKRLVASEGEPNRIIDYSRVGKPFDDQFEWLYRKRGNHFGLLLKKTNENGKEINVTYDTLLPFAFRYYQHLPYSKLVLVFSEKKTISNAFTSMVNGQQTKFCKAALYDYEKKSYTTGFNFIGVRRSDFDRGLPYAVSVDTNGRMGLINLQGEELKNADGTLFRAVFIDEFVYGKARVCLNGYLKKADETEQRMDWTMSSLQDVFAFTPEQGKMSKSDENYSMGIKDSIALRWMYIDTLGRAVFPEEYEYLRPYDPIGMICQKQGKWGVINEMGNTVIPFKYRWISNLGHFFRVFVKNPISFEFDLTGKETKKMAAKNIKNEENKPIPCQKGNFWGYCDSSKHVIIKPLFDEVKPFHNQRARVIKNGKFGCIDLAGNYIVKPDTYEVMGDFNSLGLATVRTKKDGPCGLIDSTGKLITPLKFGQIGQFIGNNAPFQISNLWGILNTKGTVKIPPKYQQITPINQGMFAVKAVGSAKFQIIDSIGKSLNPMQFDEIKATEDANLLVKIGSNNALLRINGSTQFFRSTDIPLFSSEGITAIDTLKRGEKKAKSRYLYVNEEGAEAFGKVFFDLRPFQNGVAEVKVGWLWGAMNKFGILVVPPKYGYFERKETHFTANVPSRMGLIDKTGKILLEPEYDRIELTESGHFRVELGDQIGYARRDGTWLWKLRH